jgi:DNA-binding response OmpR family regulator
MKNTVVAIFEDNQVNCFIHERLFNYVKDPVECYLFDNPEKGYEKAKQVDFDIVFIEIHFWGGNFLGIDILQKLKSIQSKDFLAVAMTSLLQEGDMALILEAGFMMCIEKPLIYKEINTLINNPSEETPKQAN